ncbi:MAG TPA: hypothetical protein VHH53_11965 [Pseudonocardiaceae bacterium]|nr:hypothetical protein [Pseudonocardiaceae bacterium]
MYTSDPIPRPAAPPATGTPLRDYLVNHGGPGVQENYLVMPRSLIEAMPLPWQNAMVQICAEFQQAFGHLSWPQYRVVPSRKERLVNLDEDQLAEVGYLVEIDSDGEVVYRARGGEPIPNPEETEVLVSFQDPIPIEQNNANQETPPRGFPAPPIRQQTNWT